MIHPSRSDWNVLAVIVVGLLAILAGCWMTRIRETPPPGQPVTRTATLIATATFANVWLVTRTPTPTLLFPTPSMVPPRPSPLAPAEYLTTTYTPNPSTLITPSPQVLPATGETQNPNLFATLLACGAAWILVGLAMLWVRKPKG